MKHHKYTNPLKKRGELTFAEVYNFLSEDGKGVFTFWISYNSDCYYDIIIFEIAWGFISLPKPCSILSKKPIGKIAFPKNEEPTSLEEAKIYAKKFAEIFWESAKNWQKIINNNEQKQS